MKLFLGRCLTAWLALMFSVPALPQQVVSPIAPVQIQDPNKDAGSGAQQNSLQLPGNFSLTPGAKPAPASANLTVGNVSSGVWGAKGQLTTTCGGINQNGTVQAPCAPEPAHFESEAAGGCPAGTFLGIGTKTCWSCPAGYQGTDHPATGPRACSRQDDNVREQVFAAKFISKKACPAGSFFDPLNNGACWTCPTEYRRSAALVTASDACVSGTGANRQETFAEVLRDNGCQAGEIHDPRNGGECWLCPTGALRTANPITGERACRIPAGVVFASANEEGPKQCGPGQFYDPARSTNANVGNRIRAQFNNQVPPALAQTLGTNNGTCWTCPVGSKRRADAVWSDKACGGSLVNMQPADYEQPGLFRLDGGEEVALAIINERTTIDKLARAIAAEIKQPETKIVAATWDEIARTPQTSAVLLAAVYAKVDAAASNPQKATPAELRLVKSFAGAIQSHRTYIAQTALDAYNVWDKAQGYYKSQTTATIATAFDLGKPPDFAKISGEAIAIAAGINVVPSVGLTAIFFNPTLKNIIFPFRQGARKAATSAAKAVTEKVTEKITLRLAVELTAEAAAKTGMLLALSAGPQIIIGLFVELIQFAAEQALAVAYAKPKLEAALAQAKAPVDVGRMLATDQGSNEVDSQWATSMNGTAAPKALAQFASAAAAVSGQSQSVSRFSIVANDGRCLTPQQGGAVLAACGTIRWNSGPNGAALQVADTSLCLTAGSDNTSINLTACSTATPRPANQNWSYNPGNGWITSVSAQRCLDASSATAVTLTLCNARAPGTPTQRWTVRQ